MHRGGGPAQEGCRTVKFKTFDSYACGEIKAHPLFLHNVASQLQVVKDFFWFGKNLPEVLHRKSS